MDESKLQEIEEQVKSFSDKGVWAAAFIVKDMQDLISEVRRLRAENERLKNPPKMSDIARQIEIGSVRLGESPKDSWNTRIPIKLPRVSPENLVEGEWYLVKEGGEEFFAQVRGGEFRGPWGEDPWDGVSVSWVTAIYGPLPKFEIEEQV